MTAPKLSPALFTLCLLAAAGCDDDPALTSPDLSSVADAGVDAALSTTLTETKLEVSLEFLNVADGGVASTFIPGAGTHPAALQITTRDGLTPVCTDVWLYTLVDGQLQELSFGGSSGRKTGHLMLPATINGQPSGLAPADDGRANGVMTDTTRGSVVQGAFVPAFDGTVQVTLPAAPTNPIVVVAGVEDQRYAGAAAILPDGTAGTVPDGVGVPETHPRRTYKDDVAPLIATQCIKACHNPTGPATVSLYPMDTREDLVNNNFAFSEQKADCETKYPSDKLALDACIQAITKAEYMVEPGAPALSDLLQRARPDEMAGTSPTGLLWYGGGTPKARYNATYGDRRMPSTTTSIIPSDWTNQPTWFDMRPQDFQILYDWIAQGAQP
jgi:hypothetical protein